MKTETGPPNPPNPLPSLYTKLLSKSVFAVMLFRTQSPCHATKFLRQRVRNGIVQIDAFWLGPRPRPVPPPPPLLHRCCWLASFSAGGVPLTDRLLPAVRSGRLPSSDMPNMRLERERPTAQRPKRGREGQASEQSLAASPQDTHLPQWTGPIYETRGRVGWTSRNGAFRLGKKTTWRH